MRRSTFLTRRFLVAVLAAAGLLMPLTSTAAPSQASPAPAVSGLTRVAAASAVGSSTSRQVAAVCPAGQTVVGGGGEIVEGRGQVVIERLQPQQTSTGGRFVVGAREDAAGFDGAWRVRATAVCADPLPGQQIVTQTTAQTSGSQQGPVASVCPTGQGVVGFGVRINNGAGQVRLTEDYEFFGPPSHLQIVGAREDPDGYVGQWSLTSYLICADQSVTDGFVVAGVVSVENSLNKKVTASCPAGMQVLTAGARVAPRLGAPATTASLVIDQVAVDSSATSVTASVTEDRNGTAAAWSVLANTLCAPVGTAGT
jgi:hypothetical protein